MSIRRRIPALASSSEMPLPRMFQPIRCAQAPLTLSNVGRTGGTTTSWDFHCLYSPLRSPRHSKIALGLRGIVPDQQVSIYHVQI